MKVLNTIFSIAGMISLLMLIVGFYIGWNNIGRDTTQMIIFFVMAGVGLVGVLIFGTLMVLTKKKK